MYVVRVLFVRQKKASTTIQSWARTVIARAAYIVALKEAKEQAKMENQLLALQKRLDDEAAARARMEEQNQKLQERLLAVNILFRLSYV
jgi:hypothetical protein